MRDVFSSAVKLFFALMLSGCMMPLFALFLCLFECLSVSIYMYNTYVS